MKNPRSWIRAVVALIPAAFVAYMSYEYWGWTLKTAGTVAALAAFGVLAGCALYNEKWPQPDQPANPGISLYSVQVDDFGSLWEPKQAQDVLEKVDAAWKNGNLVTAVFIHGWHHNAAIDDTNLQAFRDTFLAALYKSLTTPERNELRKRLTGSSEVKLIGIYIGWRGKSLPMPLDYLTVWPRKAAAERVGDGDASEFIERLQRMHIRANALTRSPASEAVKPAMTLITIGHSFGAQVLLRSVARPMEYELAERAPRAAAVTKPPVTLDPKDRTKQRVPINDFGDVNVLINPAVEAYQFARIDDLYRQIDFSDRQELERSNVELASHQLGKRQTPQLVVFSADNDDARKIAFPLSRAVTAPFHPSFSNDYQSTLYGHALGEVGGQVTHKLVLSNEADTLNDVDYTNNGGRKVRDFDFSNEVIFNGVRLTPVSPGDPPTVANSPVLVAVALSKGQPKPIIDGHNGIFGDDFVGFLTSYLSYVNGKRLLLRYEDLRAAGAR